MQLNTAPATQPEATAHTSVARMFYVWLRANCADSTEPNYRQAIYVSDDQSLVGHGELLDFPVLMKRVMARHSLEAKARFLQWQAQGLDGLWLMSDPEPVTAETVAA
jgi:hypothetical protein